MSQSDPLLKVLALAILQMEKIMSAELDRLNVAIVDLSNMVSDVGAKADATAAVVADLKAKVDAATPGVDPVAVDAAAATLEGIKPLLQGISDKLAGLNA